MKDFPPLIRQAIGYALFYAQNGRLHEREKVLSDMGSAGVQEIRENDKSGTFRVIYTVETAEYVLVLTQATWVSTLRSFRSRQHYDRSSPSNARVAALGK